MPPIIQHFSHHHLLRQLDDIQDGYDVTRNCNLCELMIDSNQICYDCSEACLYSLHKACAELPQYLDHALHLDHDHHLMLKKRSSEDTTTMCYYCDNPFQSQEVLVYACNQCSLHMHIACAFTPIPTLISNNDKGDNAQYFCHQLPMKLLERDSSKDQAKCFVCQSVWSNSAYSCSSTSCKNFLHHSCANFQLKIDRHPFHSNHPLTLQFSKPRSCNLCCKTDCRLIFRCQNNECNFNLCTKCVVPKTTVRCQSHDHSLYFVDEAFFKGVCHACQKSYTKWSGHLVPEEVNLTQSFLFRCMECNFILHFLCGPLPSIIKFDYHIHSLTLVDHYTSKYDHYDEFYCDICEKERNPYFRVYCCNDCDYVAHIHCLLYEIMKVIKGNSNDVKLMSLGESRWTDQFIDTETDDKASEVTLGVLLSNTLTDQDNAMLNHPFTFGSSFEEVQAALEQHYNFLRREINAPLFDHQLRSIENIYKINHFPSFGSEDFKSLFWELLYYRPREGLKLDEKYLRQKIVDIKGYKVPVTLASILNTLLHQYTESDLFGPRVSSWTPGMKSVLATMFCVVCDQMCRTKMKDVTKDVLQDWVFCLNAIVGTRFTNSIGLPTFLAKIIKRFFCLEAIRYERDIKEKLKLRITELEAEMKKCKEKLDMFNTQMSLNLEKIEGPVNDALRLEEKNVDEIISFGELLYTDLEPYTFSLTS
ncbi:uncharacterized protein LOC133783747 [Humulus lupulus]|uniref:uncharacterized protein LOC133783747 n=1 Tax=Humulus lupulus TaxID=3486 RepID=UPI002B402BDF|nr:uncharacterized protein LOC133783747 [Humulus lupulus]